MGTTRSVQRCFGGEQGFYEHAGYDHSYYFIATFVEDHLRHHAASLC